MWDEVGEERGGSWSQSHFYVVSVSRKRLGSLGIKVSHMCMCTHIHTHVHAHTLPQGISFIQFNNFCQLLNSLDDFVVAMMMFTIAGTSVTQEEFARAAKVCIGTPLDSSVISTVFHIFDVDGRQSPLSNTHAHTHSISRCTCTYHLAMFPGSLCMHVRPAT